MLQKNIVIDGKEYVFMKKIKNNYKMYLEYRCDEISKIKFFEYFDGELKVVNDKDILTKIINENYTIKK